MKTTYNVFFIVLISIALSACQSDKKEVITPVKQQATQKKSEKSSTKVDLSVSAEHVQKLDEDKALIIETPAIGAVKGAEKRKIELSGEVLLDKEEEELTDKVEGGKVKLSIPL